MTATRAPRLADSTTQQPPAAQAASEALADAKPLARHAAARRSPRKVDWAAWQGVHTLPLRDAVALSLNFEPETVTMDHEEFAERLRITVAQFRERRLLKLNMPDAAFQPALAQVWLPHFAAWAKARPKWQLPPEFAALAQARLSGPAKGDATPARRRAAQSKSWQHVARAYADQIHLRDAREGRIASLTEIAERVAVQAARASVTGPRGELSAQNILRSALANGQWKRPKAAAGKVVKTAATKKVVAKKAALKKPVAKKVAVKKAAPKKAVLKKAAAKKVAVKKVAAKRPATKKAAVRKAARR